MSVPLPATDVVTVFAIDLDYVSSHPALPGAPAIDGRLVVNVTREGTEAAPQLIDNAP
jgi:hypothetical protein